MEVQQQWHHLSTHHSLFPAHLQTTHGSLFHQKKVQCYPRLWPCRAEPEGPTDTAHKWVPLATLWVVYLIGIALSGVRQHICDCTVWAALPFCFECCFNKCCKAGRPEAGKPPPCTAKPPFALCCNSPHQMWRGTPSKSSRSRNDCIVEGTRWGQKQHSRAAGPLSHSHVPKYGSQPFGDKQCLQLPLQNCHNYAHPEVPTGKLAELLPAPPSAVPQ